MEHRFCHQSGRARYGIQIHFSIMGDLQDGTLNLYSGGTEEGTEMFSLVRGTLRIKNRFYPKLGDFQVVTQKLSLVSNPQNGT